PTAPSSNSGASGRTAKRYTSSRTTAQGLTPATRTGCSRRSSACIRTASFRGPVSGSRPWSASSCGMQAGSGQGVRWGVVRRSGSRWEAVMGKVLLVEDDPDDAELAIMALRRIGIDDVELARDGVEALARVFDRTDLERP